VSNGAKSAGRVEGLDSIRFICGLFVVIFHFGLIPSTLIPENPHWVGVIARAISGSLINGPAALIVFFVISGFGIHFGSRRDLTVNALSFYCRRFIRAGGPALIALALWLWSGVKLSPEEPGPFWSLICELQYYVLYPLLLLLRRRLGWWPMILASHVFAYAVIFSHLPDVEKYTGAYPAFGWLNWVVGMPNFLVGCWLAESYQRFPDISAKRIWLVRGGMAFFSILLEVARFHSGTVYLSNAVTLNIFGMITCYWLGLEIAYRRQKPAPRVLEWAGNWTYSLYLVHPALPGLFVFQIWWLQAIGRLGSLIGVPLAIVCAYLFSLVVEAPFYRLAIAVSRRVKSIRVPTQLAAQDSKTQKGGAEVTG
jgi:peptidoglycan/LPS O-acetylase OafA/YrhL